MSQIFSIAEKLISLRTGGLFDYKSIATEIIIDHFLTVWITMIHIIGRSLYSNADWTYSTLACNAFHFSYSSSFIRILLGVVFLRFWSRSFSFEFLFLRLLNKWSRGAGVVIIHESLILIYLLQGLFLFVRLVKRSCMMSVCLLSCVRLLMIWIALVILLTYGGVIGVERVLPKYYRHLLKSSLVRRERDTL